MNLISVLPIRPTALADPQVTYVPMLGVKAAEREALRDLPADVNRRIYPLLTARKIPKKKLPPIDEKTGLRRTAPSTTLEQHVKDQSEVLKGVVRIQKDFFDDGITKAMFDVEVLDRQQKQSTLARFQKELGAFAATLVPIFSVNSTDAHLTAVRRWHREYALGAALRVKPVNGALPALRDLLRIVKSCGLHSSQVDLVVDLCGVDRAELDERVAIALHDYPAYVSVQWRSVTLGSGAFPSSIARHDFDIFHKEIRWDLVAYKRVIYHLAKMGVRIPTFGDYGIFYHKFADGGTRPEANMRYTTEREWRIIRRELEPGIPVLCNRLSNENYFRGKDFSKGEAWIVERASINEESDPKTWLKAGLQQHIAFVARQMDLHPTI